MLENDDTIGLPLASVVALLLPLFPHSEIIAAVVFDDFKNGLLYEEEI
jgi:hypothetical protein